MPTILSKPINTDIISNIKSNNEIINLIKKINKNIIIEDLSKENMTKKEIINLILYTKSSKKIIMIRHYKLPKIIKLLYKSNINENIKDMDLVLIDNDRYNFLNSMNLKLEDKIRTFFMSTVECILCYDQINIKLLEKKIVICKNCPKIMCEDCFLNYIKNEKEKFYYSNSDSDNYIVKCPNCRLSIGKIGY